MRVSIVTISFNQAPFLERTIKSVLAQKGEVEIEYIIVDPGSTDGSREIIERYRARVSTIIYEPDRGPADGLNRGFAVANGELFGYVNSDDVLFPNAVSSAVSLFQRRPELDVLSANALAIDDCDRTIRKIYSDRYSLKKYAYGASILVQPSTFFRKRAYEKTGGFNIRNRCAWDGELFVDLAETGACFATVKEVWSGFRLHAGGITGSNRLEELLRTYRAGMFRRIMKRDPVWHDALRRMMYRAEKAILNPEAVVNRVRSGAIAGYSARKHT